MLIRDFLNLLLDDVVEDARLAVAGPRDALGFLGAERAAAECRERVTGGGIVTGLGALLASARDDARRAIRAGAPDQWFWFCREAQLEWIAAVFSAVLVAHRHPPVIQPTQGAVRAAARLAGVPVD